MTIVLVLSLLKTLFFLRIFDCFSHLVTLIGQVTTDLVPFILFYVILCFMFSLILGVIGFQNYTMKSAEEQIVIISSRDYPGVEYESIGRFWGNIIAVVRMSLGDNDFAATVKMDDNSIAILFWFIWVIIAYLNCIIFMNFIIAEASESYGKVMSNIENNLYL